MRINEIGNRRTASPVAYIPARKIEGLKAPLKWRSAFNCKFAEQTVFLQKTRDIRVRRSKLRAYALVAEHAHELHAPTSEDLLAVQF